MRVPTSLPVAVLIVVCLLIAAAPAAAAASCAVARRACLTAAAQDAVACRSECRRGDDASCRAGCEVTREAARSACRALPAPCDAVCGATTGPGCTATVTACRHGARSALRACRRACGPLDVGGTDGCRDRCRRARARAEAGCGYVVVPIAAGIPPLPDRPPGAGADLGLLEPEERAVIAAADARAETLRSRRVRVWIGRPGTTVRVLQTRHGFAFGFPVDVRRHPTADDLDWYARTMADHFNLAVIENTLKWRVVEPAEGVRSHAAADADVAFAEGLGVAVKGHALQWGIVPPFSSSGMPAWAFERFAPVPLPAAEAVVLRDLVRAHVVDLMARYRGRLTIWDATNETLQPLAQWFVDRLGPSIVDDVFRWAHATDPDVQLVFNEWIIEVFTGFDRPSGPMVRDRVLALRAAGVPVHAIGQQGHFVPAPAFAGIPVDLGQRTRIDDYAQALDALAGAGLPIHITETNVIAPDDPERRAAQAEGLLRLWWGTPAVEQVVFWGPWNKVAGRRVFDVGFWDDDRHLTRHGEAVLSLLNDRWRTDVTAVADAHGVVELTAVHGRHLALWDVDGAPQHAAFEVLPGAGTATIGAVAP